MSNTIEIEATANEYIIHLHRNSVTAQLLNDFIERVKVEAMADKVGFDNDILEVGEEINKNWWQQNKLRFVKDESENNH